MAQGARNRCMAICQRKAGGGMVEHAGCPGRNWMAGGALCSGRRETGGDVVGNASAKRSRALERGGVASVAIGGIQGVVVVHMAGRAWSWRR